MLTNLRHEVAKLTKQQEAFAVPDGEFQLTRAEPLDEFSELEKSSKKNRRKETNGKFMLLNHVFLHHKSQCSFVKYIYESLFRLKNSFTNDH